MKYAAEPSRYPGSELPPVYPCEFLDGDGSLIDVRYIVMADTNTGEVVALAYDALGQLVIDHTCGELVCEARHFKPPLTCVPATDPTPIVAKAL